MFGSFSDFISWKCFDKKPSFDNSVWSLKRTQGSRRVQETTKFIYLRLGNNLMPVYISVLLLQPGLRALPRLSPLRQLVTSLSVMPSVINNIHPKFHLGIWALIHPLKSSLSPMCLGSPCRAAPLLFDVSCKWEHLQPGDTAQPVCTEDFNILQPLHQPV